MSARIILTFMNLVDLNETRAGNGFVSNFLGTRKRTCAAGEGSNGESIQHIGGEGEVSLECSDAIANLGVLDGLNNRSVLAID